MFGRHMGGLAQVMARPQGAGKPTAQRPLPPPGGMAAAQGGTLMTPRPQGQAPGKMTAARPMGGNAKPSMMRRP